MSARTLKLKVNPSPLPTNVSNGPKLVLNSSNPNKPTTLKIVQPENHETTNSSPGNSSEDYRVGADDYDQKDPRTHVYDVADTYIGSDEQIPRTERILDLETMMFTEQKIDLPLGIERLFVEISSNAGDNAARSLRNGIDPGEVTVSMTKKIITVRNGGIPIPVEINKATGMYAPELIFGNMFTSSNYKKEKVRTECGRNGFGAKLTNIYSKQFIVTVGDPYNEKLYRQVWSDNMKVCGTPEIRPFGKTEKAFVEVVFILDFERFGYSEYPDAVSYTHLTLPTTPYV